MTSASKDSRAKPALGRAGAREPTRTPRYFIGSIGDTRINTEEKLDIIKELLAEKKAEDIEVIDLRDRTLIADYFVVCSGTSNTHIKALADYLLREGKDLGVRKQHLEGYSQAKWVLVDYGDVVVHIFASEEREYYDIESLWKETVVKLESAAL